ncbi:hypothetical protein [Microvirga sp. P5_D2]
MGRLSGAARSLSVYLAFALICTFGSPSVAQPTKSVVPAAVTEIDGYPFPRQLAGLPRLEQTDFHNPPLGFGVRYGNAQTWADIYVYNRDKKLTSATARKDAASELESPLEEIAASVAGGGYDDAKLVDKSTTGGFATAHLSITQRQQKRDSYVFITVSKANFVKIRLTTNQGSADQFADKLLKEYAKLLGN